MSVLVAATASYYIARSMDQGVADALGLVTLRHGTDPVTWFKIHAFGANPKNDKSQMGRLEQSVKPIPFAMANSCDQYGVNFNALWEGLDNEIKISEKRRSLGDQLLYFVPEALVNMSLKVYKFIVLNRVVSFLTEQLNPILNFIYSSGPISVIMKRVLMHTLPMVQKTIASSHLFQLSFQSDSKFSSSVKITMVSLSNLVTPTIKFRFHPDQMDERFEEIKGIPGRVVLLAKEDISPFNVGLLGSFKNSIRFSLPPLFRAPAQVIKGSCVLVAAGAVGYGAIVLFPSFVAAHRTAIIAGALLAVV